jgi:tetratricopeptide (TPR) repeat protein
MNFFFNTPPLAAQTKWQGQIPQVAQRPEDWGRLLPELINHEMYFGAMAASRNMLNFFSDLPSKEMAYGAIIKFIDLGYPFSTRADFIPGDLDPSGRDAFTQNYLLYKGIINHTKKMEKWVEYYFAKVDKENLPKYLFFRATEAYSNGKPNEAIQLLTKALTLTHDPESLILAKKEARTLARIQYELGQYEKSLDIYQNFLLKMNPIIPADWIEAAWNLYQLKRFNEALGLLYNLESKSKGDSVQLEKYVLRGLIYREFCSVAATDQLIRNFDKEFGLTINSIKMGEPLANFPQLISIEQPEAQEYRQYMQSVERLESEAKKISSLPDKLRPLAAYVYQSETAMLTRARQYSEDRALSALAKHLIILNESLRFLKFDVARERFNPDRVFAEPEPTPIKLVENGEDKNFHLHWIQWGDFWRDERVLYQGVVKKQCDR